MHLLTGIILFVILSIDAALDGDCSGLKAIGGFVLWTTVVFVILWLISSGAYIIFLIIGAIALVASLCKE